MIFTELKVTDDCGTYSVLEQVSEAEVRYELIVSGFRTYKEAKDYIITLYTETSDAIQPEDDFKGIYVIAKHDNHKIVMTTGQA